MHHLQSAICLALTNTKTTIRPNFARGYVHEVRLKLMDRLPSADSDIKLHVVHGNEEGRIPHFFLCCCTSRTLNVNPPIKILQVTSRVLACLSFVFREERELHVQIIANLDVLVDALIFKE